MKNIFTSTSLRGTKQSHITVAMISKIASSFLLAMTLVLFTSAQVRPYKIAADTIDFTSNGTKGTNLRVFGKGTFDSSVTLKHNKNSVGLDSVLSTDVNGKIINKAATNGGTVTQVNTGWGATGGPITNIGTIKGDSVTLSQYYLRRKDSIPGGYYPYSSNPLNYIGQAFADARYPLTTRFLDSIAAVNARITAFPAGTSLQYWDGTKALRTFSTSVRSVGDPVYAPIAHTHLGLTPIGGNTGQILKKNTSADYDYSWQDQDAGYVPVARTLTINGVPHDLSIDRSWTVTSTFDTATIYNNLALKLNKSDTASMLSGYVRTQRFLDSLTAVRNKEVADSVVLSTAINTKQPQLNGTGFVKASGTTISYDNSTYQTANSPITVTATGDATGTSTSSATAPSLPLTVTWPNGYPTYDARYLTTQLNHIVSGMDISYVSGLTYHVTAGTYVINGATYTFAGGDVTLAASDPSLDRQDAIILNATSLTSITGDPAANPEIPTADPVAELTISSAYIAAGATTPSGITVTVIRDEGAGGEWTITKTLTSNDAYGTNPYHLTISSRITAASNNQYWQLNAPTLQSKAGVTLVLYIRNNTTFASARNWSLQLFNNTTQVGSTQNLTSYSKTTVGSYQTITTPLSVFGGADAYNKIRLVNTGTGGTVDVQVDYFQLQSGVSNGTTGAELDPTVDPLIKAIPVTTDATTNKYYYWNNGSIARHQIPYSDISGTPSLSGYEVTSNKATDLTSPDNTKYPTTLAVSNAITASIPNLQAVTNLDSVTTHDIKINGAVVGNGRGTDSTNVAFGLQALNSNTNGSGAGDVAIGQFALKDKTSGFGNTAVGGFADWKQTSGSQNTAIGYGALATGSAVTAGSNTAIGANALNAITSGGSNTAIGAFAMQNVTTGAGNVAIGMQSSAIVLPFTNPSLGVYIGYLSKGLVANETNAIAIGYNSVGLGSNSTVIGNSSTTVAKIWGSNIIQGTGDTLATKADVRGASITESDPIVSAINGIVKSNGTTISAATVRTDYAEPTTSLATGLLKNTTTTGAHTIATAGTDYSAGTSGLTTGILKSTTSTGALTIAVAGDFPTLNQNTTGSAGKATNLVGGNGTTLLGSIPYQSNTDVTTLLSPNTTTTKKFLTQTGDATNGAAPSWGTIAAGDVPTLNQNTTGSADHVANALSISAELISGGASSYNGSAAKSIAIQAGSVTNSMLAGSISNANLANSTVTIGSTSVALGATAATIAGLTLTTPVINGTITGTGQATAATASTIAMRDANANITANNWLGGYTTAATAAGTTTLTVGSTYLQYFTGTLTQTVTMPVVSTLTLGTQYIIVNNSTGAVTVNSSGGNALTVLAGGTSGTFTSIATTGTDATVWSSAYSGGSVASGKKVTQNNTITYGGTDATTMTFPTTSQNVVGEIATETLTNKTLTSSTNVIGGVTMTLGSDATNDMYYRNSSGVLTRFASGNNGVVITSGAGVPSVSSTIPTATQSNITQTGTITSGTWNGTPPVQNTATAFAALGSAIKAEPIGFSVYNVNANATLVSQQVKFVAVYLPQAATITGVKWLQNTAGVYTASNYNGVGLYTYDGAGNVTKVASSTDDGTIWKATSATLGSKAFSGTYAAAAGLYYIGFMWSSSATTTAPVLGSFTTTGASLSLDFTNSAKNSALLVTQTVLPAGPTAMSGLSGTNTLPWVALY